MLSRRNSNANGRQRANIDLMHFQLEGDRTSPQAADWYFFAGDTWYLDLDISVWIFPGLPNPNMDVYQHINITQWGKNKWLVQL